MSAIDRFHCISFHFHLLNKAFCDGVVVRDVFIYISKTFDKVWHGGLIYKLSRDGICGNLLQLLLLSFLDSRKQRVLLNGQCWSSFKV